jgi:RNA-binding protein Nova
MHRKCVFERNIFSNFCSQLKILVPNTTAGFIIGKGGNCVKQIKEDSGSYVHLSQKAKDQRLQERCITIIGKLICLLWEDSF